jgi:hypothetical protein
MNPKLLAQSLLSTVREWVEPAFQSVNDRLDEFDVRLRQVPAGAPGADGAPGLDGKDGAPGAEGTPGRDGKDADPAYISELVGKFVDEAVAALPDPKDGAPGKDGESVHPDTVVRMVSDAVRLAVKEIPPPRDGKDADPAIIESIVRAEVIKAVADIPVPKDGVPGSAGERGQDGAPGKDADPETIRQAVADATQGLNLEFFEMADELLRGLESMGGEPITQQAGVNVQVTVPGGVDSSRPAFGLSAREHTVLSNRVIDRMQEILMMPVQPVYDATGKLLYGKRVLPAEVE